VGETAEDRRKSWGFTGGRITKTQEVARILMRSGLLQGEFEVGIAASCVFLTHPSEKQAAHLYAISEKVKVRMERRKALAERMAKERAPAVSASAPEA
jgi:hypothetical protein